MRSLLSKPTPRKCLCIFLGNLVLAFGLYNVHAVSGISEGGVLGLMLLFQHHFAISPALSGLILDVLCYGLGYLVLGKGFIGYSLLSAVSFSAFYAVCELFPPLFPGIADHPLLAAVIGAVFVGIGAGLNVSAGAATGGDDALAMSLSKVFHVSIALVYLISDLAVLALSLTYIPLEKIGYSLISVILSGQIIAIIQQKFPDA